MRDNEYGSVGNGTNVDVYFPINIEEYLDILEVETKLIEKTLEIEFIFEVAFPEEMNLDVEDIKLYNSNSVKIGDTELMISDTKETIYSFKSTITNTSSADDDYIYWLVDEGKTLNLISKEKFNFTENNEPSNNVILFSIIIGISILFLIILILFIILIFFSNKKILNNFLLNFYYIIKGYKYINFFQVLLYVCTNCVIIIMIKLFY